MARALTQRTDFVPLLKQLGIRVESPYFLQHAGAAVRFDAHLPDFGGPGGMVVALELSKENDARWSVAKSAGLYCSMLNGERVTSEQSVKDTLDDWGFYGPEHLRPAWYSGKPWC